MVDIELLTTKLLSQTTFFSQRQKALQMETLVFKTESIELQIWHKKRERDQAYQNKPAQTHPGSLQSQYQGQLEQQAKKYETELNQQAILIQRQTRMCDQLQTDCHRLESQKANLDKLIQDKSKILDEKDNKITRLNYEIRAQKQIAQGADRYDPRFYEQEKRRLNQNFQERESRWTAHTHQMEDKFDELLEGFDRMTNAAMEFDTDRMRYDRKIDELNKHVSHLEIELIEEKIKRIGFSHGEPPTTQLLRKEFRQLVADIKKAHQIRMEQEAEEIRRLQIQLEEMHNTNHTNAAYKYQQSMATQTD
ncbi:hypothetical protein CU098_010401 [Rhizopus stolonifer]|uniref:DUF7801 domain-containing protein n=1 Tax=Rhizopus stolonifer TaxID=4846 RepID=A0A367KNU6_RHIST|nr:hypothetical protein CU098_010401 [Rhizopus stolonifer]